MADDRITYTVVVDYTQNEESDVHYSELKAEILKRLPEVSKRSKGTAEAVFISIAAVVS